MSSCRYFLLLPVLIVFTDSVRAADKITYDDHIRPIQPPGNRVPALQANNTKRQWVTGGDSPLGHKGGSNREVEGLSKAHERRTRPGPRHPVASYNKGVSRG